MLAQLVDGRDHPQRARMTDACPNCGWARSSETWGNEGCSPKLWIAAILHIVDGRKSRPHCGWAKTSATWANEKCSLKLWMVDGRDPPPLGRMKDGRPTSDGRNHPKLERMKDARPSCGWKRSSPTGGCDHPQRGRMTDASPSCGWARSSATWANDGCSPKLWMDAFTHNLGE